MTIDPTELWKCIHATDIVLHLDDSGWADHTRLARIRLLWITPVHYTITLDRQLLRDIKRMQVIYDN